MPDPIQFYFDFSSPYGYFASLVVDEMAARHGRQVAWKPIMIGSAFKASGNLPLVAQPMKGEYSRHDWERMARMMKAPYRFPDRFPVPSLPPSRAYWWLAGSDPALAKRFAAAIYHAYFAENRDISEMATARHVAASLDIDPDQLEAAGCNRPSPAASTSRRAASPARRWRRHTECGLTLRISIDGHISR